MNKKNLKRILWLLWLIVVSGIALLETAWFYSLGWIFFIGGIVAIFFVLYRLDSLAPEEMEKDEFEEWKIIRERGLKTYILDIVGRVLIAAGGFLSFYVAWKYFLGQPVSEALSPSIMVMSGFMLCLSPVLAYEGWRTNEEKFSKSQSLLNNP